MLKHFLITLALVCFLSSPACAEIFKCTDSTGRLIFSDRPCPPETSSSKVQLEYSTSYETGQEVELDRALEAERLGAETADAEPAEPAEEVQEDTEEDENTEEEADELEEEEAPPEEVSTNTES